MSGERGLFAAVSLFPGRPAGHPYPRVIVSQPGVNDIIGHEAGWPLVAGWACCRQ
jgi:hypothetical protein